MTETDQQLEEVLSNLVFIRGSNRPLRDLSLADVRDRAAELRSAVGWGPTARVAPIARAWAELALEMERGGVGTVSELPGEIVLHVGPRMWLQL
jgi:hypothetical protein